CGCLTMLRRGLTEAGEWHRGYHGRQTRDAPPPGHRREVGEQSRGRTTEQEAYQQPATRWAGTAGDLPGRGRSTFLLRASWRGGPRARTGPLYPRPQCMDNSIECVRAPVRCARPSAKGLCAVRPHASRANQRLIGGGITPGITGERCTGPPPIRHGGRALQHLQTIPLQSPLGCLSWSHWEGREYRALVVGYDHTLFSLLTGVADVPQGDDTLRIDTAGIVCTPSVLVLTTWHCPHSSWLSVPMIIDA